MKQLRRLATGPEDHKRVTIAYHAHLRLIRACRACMTFLHTNSDRSFKGLISTHSTNFMAWSLQDAMDQAKMKVPRNISLSKDFANLWRPQLMLLGAIMFNVLEVFWVVDPDVPKNANLQVTLMARLLQLCVDLGVIMPRQWGVESDNATGETKNQTVAKFLAWQAWKNF